MEWLYYLDKKSQEIDNKTRRPMEEAVKQGKYPDKTPMGFAKNEDKELEINPIEVERKQLLNKKDIISVYIKFIDVSINEDYNVKIDNITFNNNFIQNKFYNIPEYLMNKFKDTYKVIKFLRIFTQEKFNKLNLENKFEIYDLNELIKYRKTDDKIDKLIKRYEEHNLEMQLLLKMIHIKMLLYYLKDVQNYPKYVQIN